MEYKSGMAIRQKKVGKFRIADFLRFGFFALLILNPVNTQGYQYLGISILGDINTQGNQYCRHEA